jgi:hypothetical protein
MDGEEKSDMTSLIQSALVDSKKQPTPNRKLQVGGETSNPVPDIAIDKEALEVIQPELLIDVFFELEDPLEREALLDELSKDQSDVTGEFYEAVFDCDEDDYIRALAGAELALRGHPRAQKSLMEDFEDPDEHFFFVLAMRTLCRLKGIEFYPVLREVWNDPLCDGDRRSAAMGGMELLDSARALEDFIDFINNIVSAHDFPDDQVEIAMATFIRHDYHRAGAVLTELQNRVLGSQMDADERQELCDFINEGISLLKVS